MTRHLVLERRVAGAAMAAMIFAGCVFAAVPPARAWDLELKRAILQVYLGTASPAQRTLVLRNNDVVNAMAGTGHLPDRVYQKVQSDFAEFNRSVASEAAEKNGLDLASQVRKADRYNAGTDSDYLTASRSGRMSPGQVEGTISDYNRAMNEKLGTSSVDYATKLNTDFMGDPGQMTREDFAAVSRLNNDAYARQAAATYEAKVRSGGGPPVTVDEAIEYKRQMGELIAKKSRQIADLEARTTAAFGADPDGALAQTRNLQAELQIRRQQQAKYLERYTDAVRRTAAGFGLEVPATSDLPSAAADRSTAPVEGRTQAEQAATRAAKAAASSGLQDHLGQSVRTAGAVTDAGAAASLRNAGAALPESGALIDSAVEQIVGLPASRQGEIIEMVRRQSGDAIARDLATRVRAANAARPATAPAATAEPAAATKAMQVVAIAGLANEARAWIAGEKTNWEAAEAVADLVSQGYFSVGRSLAGWKQTADANLQAYRTESEARIYAIAVGLHRAGVGVDEVKAIVRDLEGGSRTSLEAAIGRLGARGVGFVEPPPVERTVFSDETWKSYAIGRGWAAADMVKDMALSPLRLAWGTGRDIGELVVLTTDVFEQSRNAAASDLVVIETQNEIGRRRLIDRLVGLGASPEEATAAVEAWAAGRTEGLERLRALRDRLKGAPVAEAAAAPVAGPVGAELSKQIEDRLANLDRSKLDALLDRIGTRTPEGFYACLCSGKWHAGHVGVRYNGETGACHFSGFGEWEEPLPSAAEAWKECIDTRRYPDGRSMTEVIAGAVGDLRAKRTGGTR